MPISVQEQLKANIITKYLGGWCTKEEERELENWLKNNTANRMFFQIISMQYNVALSSING